jgi:hypothetical protein
LVNIAVSDRPGKLNLYEFGPSNIGRATTVASLATQPPYPPTAGALTHSVEALPLLDILTPEERSRLRLIKLDVEGAEPPIIRNILSNLSDYPPTMDILVEASCDDSWGELVNELRAAGFSGWVIDNYYKIDWYLRWQGPNPPQPLDVIPSGQQVDILLTRREKLT